MRPRRMSEDRGQMARGSVGRCWTLALAALFGIALFGIAPSGARAQSVPVEGEPVEIIDYVVVAGDSCAGISRRLYGNGRRYDIIHAYNPDMGPPPHRLVPGTVLHLPRTAVSSESIPDARVTAREREVTARPADLPEWRAAPLGLELYRGWHVSTEERSSAELTFADTSVLGLRADTLVIIFGDSSRRVRRGGTEARVERGSLRTALGSLRGTDAAGANGLRIVTPSAQASMRGGSSVVSVDDAGTSRVSAHEGEVSLTDAAGRGRTRVPEGMGSAVATGARPTRPQPLPDAPAWVPGALRFLAAPGRGADVSGAWQPVTNARVYRVEIARQASGRDLAAAVEVPADVTRFELVGLPAGHYFVRLATIDQDFFESRPSSPIELVVEHTALFGPDGAPLTLDAPDPSADPVPAILPPGSRLALPEGVSCTDARMSSPESGSLPLRHASQPTCVDATGAAVGLPHFLVPALGVTLATPTLERGRSGRLVVRPTEGEMPIPEGATLRATGLTLGEVRRDGGGLEAEATVPDDASDTALVEVVAADGVVLAAATVTLTQPAPVVAEPEAPEPEAPAPEAPAPPRALLAAVGAPFASTVALRAFDERGVGATFAVSGVDEREDGTRVRTAFEMFGTFFDDQLRLSLAVPVDPTNAGVPASYRRGSTDVLGSVGWIFGTREPISVLVDLAAWAPTMGEASLRTVRFVPSLELAVTITPGFAFRTRQSAIIELSDGGVRRWASAYGLDLTLFGPLGLLVEGDLSIGEEAGARPLDAAFVAGLLFDLDALGLSIAGRFGTVGAPGALGETFGPAEIHVTLRGTAP